jgi:F-type H+-transporting ATPase subunit c
MDSGLIAIGAALAIAIAAGCAGLGIGMASGKAFEASARQPELAGKIQAILLTAIVFIEATAIYALVVSLLLIFAYNK